MSLMNIYFKKINRLFIAVVASLLLLTGCASVISLATNDPVQENMGKRSWGAVIDDQTIETIAAVNIKKADPLFSSSHVTVTSFNGVVLLTGQVPIKSLKKVAEDTVRQIRNVREIYNELEIAGPTTALVRSSDSWLTAKIKANMVVTNEFPASRIKILTENGVVYLMGLLTQKEAREAVNLVQSSYGVQKIVKVFEYLNDKN